MTATILRVKKEGTPAGPDSLGSRPCREAHPLAAKEERDLDFCAALERLIVRDDLYVIQALVRGCTQDSSESFRDRKRSTVSHDTFSSPTRKM